eukprot:CAMPEP_0172482094 /NCGR_PEP_ID=MMETSP1066-20121228/8363_1 /TAXON_ID=671091 /ORGANISM="Coscinodiscus wailesii, Strain CCMP2513" /LENGTH=221 /DNA_ID=CAMNT_0013244971 /DNA_START=195 /DNA_END=860 /DNA_ORIENTATION=-
MRTIKLRNVFKEHPTDALGDVFSSFKLNNVATIGTKCKDYYSGLQRTYREVRRKAIKNNWKQIYLRGGIDQVKRILEDDEEIDPSDYDLFKVACDQFECSVQDDVPEDKRTELFCMLWKDFNVDPSAHMNMAICFASEYNCFNLVEALLADSRVDPSAWNNNAICRASREGNADVVELLLGDPRVDPCAKNNYALRRANRNGHYDVVEVLLSDPRVNPNIR